MQQRHHRAANTPQVIIGAAISASSDCMPEVGTHLITNGSQLLGQLNAAMATQVEFSQESAPPTGIARAPAARIGRKDCQIRNL